MHDRCYMGLDPGASSGGLAIITTADLVLTEPFARLTERETWEYVLWAHGCYPDLHVVLEQIRYRPGTPGPSIARLATHYGLLRGLVTAAGVTYGEVPPSQWMQALRLPRGGTASERKRALRQRASELYPAAHVTDATAAAVLLAHYGRVLG